MTLIRCMTGEAWNEIFVDLKRHQSIVFECDDEPTYDKYIAAGETIGCGSSFSFFFYLFFLMTVTFIFLNLFIAIIIQAFSSSNEEEELSEHSESVEKFKKYWKEFDKNGDGSIALIDLEPLILKLVQETNIIHERVIEYNRRARLRFIAQL